MTKIIGIIMYLINAVPPRAVNDKGSDLDLFSECVNIKGEG
jgi:hypothetical protein